MRATVDLSEADLRVLDDVARETGKSREEVIEAALADYLARLKRQRIDAAFGLWGHHEVDGLEYERKLRAEW
ncbi:ribbon-helix-helix domain-containing protein [Alsobacter sp. KACC 23698]|jgi:predicted transcriptional regulator|uniref:Ribbon-helix-helix domain-containing protein n=1 Tax=Alsobacter sp. KACC 23698 TaxID=3149229 RepID=A0AAU7JHX8_9HYPH